jgi:GT2 family glycosyltransferase/SAM-dependent methyltransferase/glycosyltransferase involved in cell wall biosynthesis
MGELFQRAKPSSALEWTGERLTTAADGQVETEHLHRYFLARELVRGLDVLDIASGEGYGSALLAQSARSVVGVEIDPTTVAHAASHYSASNLTFIQGAAQSIPLGDASVDAVVSFETVEHIYEQEQFLAEIRRVLKPGGIVIISSPNRDVYSAPGTPPNPHHVRELAEGQFAALVGGQFTHIEMFGQRPIVGSVIVGAKSAVHPRPVLTFDRRSEDIFECSSGFDRILYYLIVASNNSDFRVPDTFYFDLQAIDDLIATAPALQRALKDRDQELSQRQGEVDRLAETGHQLAAEVEHQAATVKRLTLELESESAERHRLTAEIERQTAAGERLTSQLESLSSQLESQSSQLESQSSELKRQSSVAEQSLQALAAAQTALAELGARHSQSQMVMAANWEGLIERLSWIDGTASELTTETEKVLRQPWRPTAQRLLYLLFSALAVTPGGAGAFFQRQAEQRTPERLKRLVREAEGHSQWWLECQRLGNDQPTRGEPRRRILVADYRVPRPDVSAGERATVGILKDLCALGYEVTFLAGNLAPGGQYEEDLRRLGVTVITGASGFASAAKYVETHGNRFGVFYLIRVEVAEALLAAARFAAPSARIIFHAPDLHFLREQREADYHSDEEARRQALRTRQREIAMMTASDHVVVVSPSEVPILQPLIPGKAVSVFPVLYAPVADHPAGYGGRSNVFFLGGFGHSPNIEAVRWFANEVWPHVRATLPDVEFHIVGAEAPPSIVELGARPGVKVVGYVKDLDDLLATFRVGVAPLLFGAGIKGKVAMTMGAGVPCVCTTIAAEGMSLESNVHTLIEDDARAFADAVVRVYRDEALWARLSEQGRLLVAERFGDAANRASLVSALNDARALSLPVFCEYCAASEPRAFPEREGDVDVSIIVPVYNKWALTRACLTSIVQTSLGAGIRYEVILADDSSTDETIHAASAFPGLRVARTPSNLGFLRNCNNAAQGARGRYLLLLNNDTVVMPDWLDSLHRVMEDRPEIAIAGSKLLYPDGRIQEAGGAIFADGRARNVGRGRMRDDPQFSTGREVDYISGASIMVRRKFWEAVNGFDERFKIAYCEDSELAMSARALGMTVWYEPSSEVVHFEHQSYHEQEGATPSELQLHNTALLLEKWGSVLARDHGPAIYDDWYIPMAARPAPVREHASKRPKSLVPPSEDVLVERASGSVLVEPGR